MYDPNQPEDSLLSVQQVLCLVPMGKTTLYSMIALGEFPKPVKIRAMAVWHKKIVVDWLNKIYEKQVEENQP